MKTVLFSLFLAVNFLSFAQQKEIELELDNDIEDMHSVIPVDSNGIILLNFKIKSFSRKRSIVVMKFNKELKETWKLDLAVKRDEQVVKYYIDDTNLHVLLQEPKNKEIVILRINIANGDFVVFDQKLLTGMEVFFFGHLNNKYMIAGEYEDRPVAELYNVIDNTCKVLPQLFNKNQLIQSLDIQNNEFYFTVKDENKCLGFLYKYDTEGKHLGTTQIGSKDKVILTTKFQKLSNGELLITGNYADYCSDFSSGFYVMKGYSNEQIHYYPFHTFKNYFSHLPPKRRNRLQSRMDMKVAKGKNSSRRVRVNLQDPRIIDGEIVLLAEVYYAEFQNNTTFMNRTVSYLGDNYLTVEGYNKYRYPNAIICTFDMNGKLTWDYSLDLENLVSVGLSKKVHYSEDNNELIFAFPNDKFVNFKKVSKHSLNTTELPKQKIKQEEGPFVSDITIELSHWYKDKFVSYGYKTVRINGNINPKEYFYIKNLDSK